jgi:hypothetical protein
VHFSHVGSAVRVERVAPAQAGPFACFGCFPDQDGEEIDVVDGRLDVAVRPAADGVAGTDQKLDQYAGRVRLGVRLDGAHQIPGDAIESLSRWGVWMLRLWRRRSFGIGGLVRRRRSAVAAPLAACLPLRRITRFTHPSGKPGLDGVADALEAVVSRKSAGPGGVLQRAPNPATVEPSAGNQLTQLERCHIQGVVPFASSCRGDGLYFSSERGLDVGPLRRIIVGMGVLPGWLATVRPVRFLRLAVLAEHGLRLGDEGDDLFLADFQQCGEGNIERIAIQPEVRLLGVRVDGEGDELLTIGQGLDLAGIAVDQKDPRLLLAERHRGAIGDQQLRWLADPGWAVAKLRSGHRVQLGGGFFVQNVDIDADDLAAQQTGAAIAILGECGVINTEGGPAVHRRSLGSVLDGQRLITVCDQLPRNDSESRHRAVSAEGAACSQPLRTASLTRCLSNGVNSTTAV